MATKYLLQTLEGETLETVSKKQTAMKKAEQRGLLDFRVVTDSGNVVFERVPEEEPLADEDRELPDGWDTIPAKEDLPCEQDDLFYEFLDFPGNYSIVTAPGAVEVAEAAGVPAKVETFKGKLTRRVHFGGSDMDLAQRTVSLVLEENVAALAALKEYQEKTRAERRGLTDMQKYLQHRDVLAKHFSAVAARVRKDGV